MICVIFEVTPTLEGKSEYFKIANELKAILSEVNGYISIERFQSLSDPDTFLSLSFWENETAIKQWRENFEHKIAQEKGKKEIFLHYRIRVGHIIRDYGGENIERRSVSQVVQKTQQERK
ncbi:antibiotic biosynthesis monooxygenase family protein [Colwellia sp. Bg11-28]|uniref:antibiotic biosynthesis monooxygenase family protein n=1 Tax=Colwellia sp. Bg11-28 TaxID=2058305 RepID=UPI000C322AE3|nr:antibiotic biosynthesis monooxygenase [Colwellia sp. Bg11-28]PKH89009.1 antibiotic biosynthesis monooxygenase [Colwellia sp. Bg11-28]